METYIWDEIKEVVPATALVASILVAFISNGICIWDASHKKWFEHKKFLVSVLVSIVACLVMWISGFFQIKEILWHLFIVFGGSSVFYNIAIKKRT